jgi:bifunctional UDP-N-acetylglucosamine pyrophosphorylase / glucosamine-1-phosphate N-acetyltransferase
MNQYNNIQGIILAAGKSTRFKRNRSKLTEKICGQEMILFPTKLLAHFGIKTSVVTGYQKNSIEKIVQQAHNENITFIHQEELLGTGHAILCALPIIEKEHVLIINGDAPLITPNIIESLFNKHFENKATLSFVTALNADQSINSYGIVIDDINGIRIIEAKDYHASINQETFLINAGIYIIEKSFLIEAINTIKKSSITGEIYLTELVHLASLQKLIVSTVEASFDAIRGVNDLKELWVAEHLKRSELIQYWMNQGIRFMAVQSVHIDLNVKIGTGSSIGAGVQLLGSTTIGENCSIGSFSSIENTTIQDNVIIHPHCVIKDAHIENKSTIGPFAHVHTQSYIHSESIIGNFVEIKKSTIGNASKIKHLAYIGDATLGKHVNIGAGTITCNHDGIHKHPTIIKDNAYIGSNNTLVAPITINKGAYTAAGSTITEDVPEYALAIARNKQINKEQYVHKLLQKKNNTYTSCDSMVTVKKSSPTTNL